jgi:hypothetical protein
MCLIMLMANRGVVVLYHVECVVRHVSWIVNVQVLCVLRWSIGDGEGQARKSVHDGPRAVKGGRVGLD